MKDFFISYNKADRSWAEWIAWVLEEEGYSTVIQAWDFRPGSNFVLEMQKATAEAERTIAVLSPDYLTSLFTQPEWAATFVQDATGEQRKLVPVRVRECKPDGLLKAIVYIDLVGSGEAAARQTLLGGLSKERAKPTHKPDFPGGPPRLTTDRPRFPGTLPPIWKVPHDRNLNFTGRVQLLTDLRNALTSRQPAALVQTLHGLGGVGKTQLAVEYAYRHMGDYNLVWWARSEAGTTLASDYAALAVPLDLPQREATDQGQIVAAVRDWLGRNGGWLLVFDNVPHPPDVRGYLPQGHTGHVIITSRDPNWRGTATPLRVEVMTRAKAVAFLLKRTGQTDEDTAGKIAEALGDLPLALEQAGAYIEEGVLSLADYLERFKQYELDVLRRGKPSTDYPHTVETTWSMAFDAVRKEAPAAIALLNICGFLAPDDIPLDLFQKSADVLRESAVTLVSNSLEIDEAVAALRRYALAERQGGMLSVHRLVQAITRECLGEEDSKTWAEVAVRLVSRAFPYYSDNVRTWTDCARLLPHALAVAGNSERHTLAANAAGRLLNQAGLYLLGRAQYPEAKTAFERALRASEVANGPNHPTTATAVNNLGAAMWRSGDLAEAGMHVERALRIGEAIYGPSDPTVAIRVNNLGMILHELRDLAGALAHFKRALRVFEAAFGPVDPTVATCMNNLGSVLEDLGDLMGARAYYERALRIDEAAYDPDHPTVARDVNSLGGVLRVMGDLTGARAQLERALVILQKSLGDDHPDTKIVRRNLESLDK